MKKDIYKDSAELADIEKIKKNQNDTLVQLRSIGVAVAMSADMIDDINPEDQLKRWERTVEAAKFAHKKINEIIKGIER